MAAAGGQRIEQALEPPQPVAVLGEHPATDRVGEAPEAVELQFKEPPVAIERLLAANGDDRLHRPGNRAKKRPSQAYTIRRGGTLRLPGNCSWAGRPCIPPSAPAAQFETPAFLRSQGLCLSRLSAPCGTETGCRAGSVRGRPPFIEEEKHYELDYANSRGNLHLA